MSQWTYFLSKRSAVTRRNVFFESIEAKIYPPGKHLSKLTKWRLHVLLSYFWNIQMIITVLEIARVVLLDGGTRWANGRWEKAQNTRKSAAYRKLTQCRVWKKLAILYKFRENQNEQKGGHKGKRNNNNNDNKKLCIKFSLYTKLKQPGTFTCGCRAAVKAFYALSVKAQWSSICFDCNLPQSGEGMKTGREMLTRSNVLIMAAARVYEVRNSLLS